MACENRISFFLPKILSAEYLIHGFENTQITDQVELSLPRERKASLKHSNIEDQFQLLRAHQKTRIPRIAFGVIPLTTPYDESDPEHRVLNAVARGLLFERMKEPTEELEMSKLEYSRALRSLKSDKLIYVGSDGKFRLTFGTSNFPNIIARDEGI